MAELIAYAARTGTKRNLAGIRKMGWRLLVSAAGEHRTEGFEDLGIGLDNGAWSVRETGAYPDDLKRAFIRLMCAMGAIADWAVPPDLVAGGAASLALSLRWLAWVLTRCQRALLAVQDGITEAQVRPYLGADVGVFVGGTTSWKLATMAGWADLARERGAWCHVARVNSALRIRKVALAGATSFDGSSASRFALSQPRLGRAVDQQFLVFEEEES
jgi:hypothetical protein